MQALAGLVTGLNLILSLVVGLRLFGLARREWSTPELALAVYFLASAVLSTPPQIVVYAGLSDPSMRVPDDAARWLLAIAVLAMAVGAAGVYVFTWKTFWPRSRTARRLALAGCGVLALGYALEAALERFTPAIFAGVGHWIGWAGRSGAMLWVAVESFHYYARMRRRLRLGLADPVVANRFVLWGLFAGTGLVNYLADLASRSVYVWLAGTTTEFVPAVLEPVILATVLSTMVLGTVSAVTLFLTFFPTRGYRRWLERRAAASA